MLLVFNENDWELSTLSEVWSDKAFKIGHSELSFLIMKTSFEFQEVYWVKILKVTLTARSKRPTLLKCTFHWTNNKGVALFPVFIDCVLWALAAMCSAPGMCSWQTHFINPADKKVEFQRTATVPGGCLCSGLLQDIEEVKLCQERMAPVQTDGQWGCDDSNVQQITISKQWVYQAK